MVANCLTTNVMDMQVLVKSFLQFPQGLRVKKIWSIQPRGVENTSLVFLTFWDQNQALCFAFDLKQLSFDQLQTKESLENVIDIKYDQDYNLLCLVKDIVGSDIDMLEIYEIEQLTQDKVSLKNVFREGVSQGELQYFQIFPAADEEAGELDKL